MILVIAIDKQFDPHAIEQRWYPYWEKCGYFRPTGKGTPFCIMLPPPNVTGSLHMGHGFQQTLMDILIRYHRMRGDNTLWQPGTDHAGIATQMVVERQLMQAGIHRQDLGREAFIAKIWEWQRQSGSTISKQMRRLGASAHWENECFTLDAGLSKAVHTVFIRLYEEGLIYRSKRLVNWDPKLLTAISDLEVEATEEAGYLWYIRYQSVAGGEDITIATTRPETLFGDTAIAVHPEDQRYAHFIGSQVRVPLTERTIPVIADTSIDPTFGTGCVKITPAHDFNDYRIGQRHQLPLLTIFHPNATLNNHVPIEFQGLDRFVAREKVVATLMANQQLVKTEKRISVIPRGDRSGEIIEPYLTDQWFVKVASLAEPALEAVRQGHIKFYPEVWTKTYYQWMENIEDWCISRQLWWGHRIPAWYDADGNTYIAESEEAVRSKYQLDPELILTQDEDVLDTWFSSALWPFSTLGWPEQTTGLLQTFYPSSVLISGFDIIFFWIARMIMLGLKFQHQIPFKDVYITGLIRDSDGQKMSKTKGNVIDPLDLIDGIELSALIQKRTYGLMQPQKAAQITTATRNQFPNGIASYGTDSLRFTFCSLASFNRELRFDMTRMDSHRNFCNKLWNAARYVLIHTQESPVTIPNPEAYSIVDRWIWSRLQALIVTVEQQIHQYRFDWLAKTLYEFVWNEYCDWYLELTKPILNGDASEAQKNATRYSLIHILETLLRLLHPIIPFITEEIWQHIKRVAAIEADCVINQPYPKLNAEWVDSEIEQEVEWLKQIISAVRSMRSEINIAPSKRIPLLLQYGCEFDQQRIQRNQLFLQALAKVDSLAWLTADANAPVAATSVVGELQLLIPLAGVIDTEAELARLTKAIVKLDKELGVLTEKLNQQHFITRAPANLVAAEQARQHELQHQLTVLHTKAEQLKALQSAPSA